MLTVNLSIYDTAKILQNLEPNKAHGHDKISIRMLRLCDNSICKPVDLILKQSMESNSSPTEWKKMELKNSPPCISATSLWKNF